VEDTIEIGVQCKRQGPGRSRGGPGYDRKRGCYKSKTASRRDGFFGKQVILKEIYVKGRIVNIVVK
jgi:hypothetical protein